MKRKKILVAEDEVHILKSLKLVLEEAGYLVVTAVDGQEAFYKTKEENPDLVILDVTMPRMNGYEIYVKLRSDPLHRDIPVMILTAVGQADQKRDELTDRSFDVVTKPFSPYSVLDKINHILNN